jgi:hypothetical protein
LRGHQQGQALAFFALVLPLVLLPVAAFGVEAGWLAARQAHLAEVTAQAALDAAQQLDTAALRAGGVWRLDPAAARQVVTSDLALQEPAAVLDGLVIAGARLTVTVHESVPLQLGAFAGPRAATLRAVVSARLAAGYGSASG